MLLALAMTPAELDVLHPTIVRQSTAAYVVADRLALAVNTLAEYEISASQQVLYSLLLVSLFVVVVAFFVINGCVRSMSRLEHAAEQLGQGNLTERIPVEHINEIARVSKVFNAMADQIEQRIGETQVACEQAERADKVKSAFLASMSHELRTPLNAVINFTIFVARGDLGPVNDRQRDTLNDVVESGKHLLNLINDILDMSKIESGSLRLFISDEVDVRSLLGQVEGTAKLLLHGKAVSLRVSIADDFPRIRADRQRVLQILLNIVANACKFTEAGEILICARRYDETIQLEIRDTGPGIPAEDQAAVFERFKQTETGLRQGGGTGLGMPITKSLVEAHGGHIQLISAPGIGTTVIVTLPTKADALVPIPV